MTAVTACVLTKNEERDLPGCLASLKWADAVQVLDSGSTDRTVEIARAAGAEVLHRDWTGFYDQRVHQFAQPKTEWIFWLDADERCSAELQREARELLRSEPPRRGYTAPRLTYFLKKPIRHCGWFPDRMPRLFRKDAWRFEREGIHARIEIDGGAGEMQGLIHHDPYPTLAEYYAKMGSYARETADYKFRQGKRCGLLKAIAVGPAVFAKLYVARAGFLDGAAGLAVSWLGGISASMKYFELYQRTRDAGSAEPTAR